MCGETSEELCLRQRKAHNILSTLTDDAVAVQYNESSELICVQGLSFIKQRGDGGADDIGEPFKVIEEDDTKRCAQALLVMHPYYFNNNLLSTLRYNT